MAAVTASPCKPCASRSYAISNRYIAISATLPHDMDATMSLATGRAQRLVPARPRGCRMLTWCLEPIGIVCVGRYASTLNYGRALMGRASRENITCRGHMWDIFPLRSDYGGTSMAWVGLLAWAIYMALTPPSMAWRGPRSVGEIQSSRMIKIREFFHAV